MSIAGLIKRLMAIRCQWFPTNGWERFEDKWTSGFIAWRNVTGAVIWRFDGPDDREWAYASSSVDPTHGDTGPRVGASYPPNAASIDEAKKLALALREGTP